MHEIAPTRVVVQAREDLTLTPFKPMDEQCKQARFPQCVSLASPPQLMWFTAAWVSFGTQRGGMDYPHCDRCSCLTALPKFSSAIPPSVATPRMVTNKPNAASKNVRPDSG